MCLEGCSCLGDVIGDVVFVLGVEDCIRKLVIGFRVIVVGVRERSRDEKL